MREPLPESISYLRVCGPLTCRHQKETRCLPVCVVKRLQLGEQRWLRLRSLPRGARPLLLRSSLIAILGFPLSPGLLGSRHFFEAQ